MEYNPEKVGRSMKTLAQLPFRFWRELYRDRIIVDERPDGIEYLTAHGTLHVLITSSTQHENLILVSQRPYSSSPRIYICCGERKVAEYEGKLHPPYVYDFVLADDAMNGLEKFSAEVKKKFDSWR